MAQQDAEEKTQETAKVEDKESLREALAREKARVEANLNGWQRAQADFINYKRRAEQEKEEIGKFANTTLILSLLPILDDLERAFDSMPHKATKHSWLDGIKLIERKFQATLEALGVVAVKALGEPFDPRFHEAVRQDKGKEGIVIEEIQKGYLLHDRLLRPAKVVVGTGEEEEEEQKED